MDENVRQILGVLYVSPLLISTVVGLIQAVYIFTKRAVPSARSLAGISLGAAVWSAGYAMELLNPDLSSKLLWARFEYFGIVIIPIFWFIFAVWYSGSPKWFARSIQRAAWLALIPLVTLVLVWTNDLHGLVWRDYHLQSFTVFSIMHIDHGPWFWINLVYGYTLMLAGSILLINKLMSSVRLNKWQIRLALLAILIPWIGNLLYITQWNPVPGFDWTPFLFVFSSFLFTISLFRFNLVDILPIAKDTVFMEQPDCMIVLDLRDQIVDLNPAAEDVCGQSRDQLMGKPLSQAMPKLNSLLQGTAEDDVLLVEIPLGDTTDERYYEVRSSPLTSPYDLHIGRLITCHDITELRKGLASLKSDYIDLEEMVLDQTQELMKTVQHLQDELNQRRIAEKKFQDVVESAPDALLLIDRTGLITLANAQAENLFSTSRQELEGSNIEEMVPDEHLDWYHQNIQAFFANPSSMQGVFYSNLSALRKDGSQFPVELRLGALLNTKDEVLMACTLRDITQRIRAQEEQQRLLENYRQTQIVLQALAVRLQEVQEAERRQIAAEIHDMVGQNLTGLSLNLQIVENQLGVEISPDIKRRLNDALNLVEQTTRQVRDVMLRIHPPMLDEYGLHSAIQWYGKRFSQRTKINVHLDGSEFQPRLPQDIEMALFRLVQEALTNTAKHADANRVDITMETDGQEACLTVQDNGKGFDPQSLNPTTSEPRWGLITMEQRVDAIGGELKIESTPGKGTMISVSITRGGES